MEHSLLFTEEYQKWLHEKGYLEFADASTYDNCPVLEKHPLVDDEDQENISDPVRFVHRLHRTPLMIVERAALEEVLPEGHSRLPHNIGLNISRARKAGCVINNFSGIGFSVGVSRLKISLTEARILDIVRQSDSGISMSDLVRLIKGNNFIVEGLSTFEFARLRTHLSRMRQVKDVPLSKGSIITLP